MMLLPPDTLVVASSLILEAGNGLFYIGKKPLCVGQQIWRFQSGDLAVSHAQLARVRDLDPHAGEVMDVYSYDCVVNGVHVLCGDKAAFYNHDDKNPTTRGGFAADCPLGFDEVAWFPEDWASLSPEARMRRFELTQNYHVFDARADEKLGMTQRAARQHTALVSPEQIPGVLYRNDHEVRVFILRWEEDVKKPAVEGLSMI